MQKKEHITSKFRQAIYIASLWSTPKKLCIFSFGLLIFSFLLLLGSFLLPRNVELSYSEPTCVGSFVLLPGLYSANGDDISIKADRSLYVWDYPVVARSLCLEPKRAPQPGEPMAGVVALRGLPILQQRINVSVPDYPRPLQARGESVVELSIRDNYTMAFSQADNLFTYEIRANGNAQACFKNTVLLSCSLSELSLEQASEYDFSVERTFRGQDVEPIAQKTLRTLDPLEVIESSIEPDELVYEKPSEIEIVFNKSIETPLETGAVTLSTADGAVLPVEATVDEQKMTVALRDDLPREIEYILRLSDITATDKSVLLADPWELSFATSGGPEITQHTLRKSSMSVSESFVLTFDQALDEDQDIQELIELKVAGQVVSTQYSITANTIEIQPDSDLSLCQPVELALRGQLVSEYDVEANLDWSASGRVTCKQTSIIGYSVQDRPIYAYSFGDGSDTILYVGGMHGNEYSSVVLMDEWIKELDANPRRIPADKKLIIIPRSCPDCVVARSRLNAREVDLNRNFPTDDWQSEVSIPGPQELPEGGGTEALSEPSAKALADLVRRERPKLTLTYHAVANIVISNDAGSSISWGREYARLSRYGFSTTNQIEDVFNYTATGAFEDWIHDELNLPALLVELGTMTGNEMARNRSALWYTAEL